MIYKNKLFNVYSWTSLCQSGRDQEKYFDIGIVRDYQLGIMGSQNISFKKNAYFQASFYSTQITAWWFYQLVQYCLKLLLIMTISGYK